MYAIYARSMIYTPPTRTPNAQDGIPKMLKIMTNNANVDAAQLLFYSSNSYSSV